MCVQSKSILFFDLPFWIFIAFATLKQSSQISQMTSLSSSTRAKQIVFQQQSLFHSIAAFFLCHIMQKIHQDDADDKLICNVSIS